jgi:type VI secretion system secreted protein VgrG
MTDMSSADGGRAADALAGLAGIADDVSFELEIEGLGTRLGVRHLTVHEGLNRLGEAEVTALVGPGETPVIADLLGRDCTITWARPAQERKFRGVVRTGSVRDLVEGAELAVHIVPALWMLSRTLDSRIYQDKSIPKIVEDLVGELLGSRQRSVRNDLSRDYPTYEYVVQYQESHWSFIARLLEQEGIFAYFDHEGDHETLVLADTTSNLPFVRASDQGRVPYAADASQVPGREAVTAVMHHREVGATDAVVSDYDWTNPGMQVRGSQTGRGNGSPTLEIYDHTDAVQFHRYSGTSYGANTADRQAELRAELLDLAREAWSMDATVVTAAPGRILELSGAPEGDLDAKYLIVSTDSYGHTTEGRTGAFHTRVRCVPQDKPYRPPRFTRRPVVVGLETATVVGPAGEEIHTDEHGRVRVQFHWDRQGRDDEHSTCWLRVMQSWAHAGFGTFFLPRIGMEVVVGFIGGSPDRPIVTGCVYNGQNTTPYSLPGEKTKSTLKTQSSPGGGGYNELRFEDKTGSEEVFIHAQKDFNEVVEHNHTTRVHANHTNTVDGDDTETVHQKQKLTVKKDREKTIEENEFRTIKMSRFSEIQMNDTMTITGTRTTIVKANEERFVDGTRTTKIKRTELVELGDSRETKITGKDLLDVSEESFLAVGKAATIRQNGTVFEIREQKVLIDSADSIRCTHAGSQMQIAKGGSINLDSDKEIKVKNGSSVLLMGNGNVVVNAPGSIVLQCGGSSIALDPGQITIASPSIVVNGVGHVSVVGGIITLN